MSARYEVVEVETVRRVNSDPEKPGFTYHDEETGSADEFDDMDKLSPLTRASNRIRSFAELHYTHYHALARHNPQLRRYFAPGCLLVSVLLFLALCGLPGASSLTAPPILNTIVPNPSVNSKLALEPLRCPARTHAHRIAKDDSCWDIATIKGTDVAGLLRLNPGLDCARLEIGGEVCVPGAPEESEVLSKLQLVAETLNEADFT